jgi:hypothetical protein
MKIAELTDALDSRVLGVELPPGGHGHDLKWGRLVVI